MGPHETPMNRPQRPGAVQALASHPVSGTEPRPHHLPSLLRTWIDLGLGGVTLRAGCAPGRNSPGSSSPPLPPTLLTVLQSPRPHSVLEPELTPPPPPEGDSSPGCMCRGCWEWANQEGGHCHTGAQAGGGSGLPKAGGCNQRGRRGPRAWPVHGRRGSGGSGCGSGAPCTSPQSPSRSRAGPFTQTQKVTPRFG